jgi:hypothetical protein
MEVNKYERGKVYSIRSHMTDEVYIGSTTQTLGQRLGKHRSSLKSFNNGKGNVVTSFKILEYPDHYIELVELAPCGSKMELERREGQIIREAVNCVNKFVAGRTPAEYYQDNIDIFSIKNKLYYQNNNIVIKQKHVCPCGGKFTHAHKASHNKTKKHIRYLEQQL